MAGNLKKFAGFALLILVCAPSTFSVPQNIQGLEQYYYSILGEDSSSDNFFVRVKRDTSDEIKNSEKSSAVSGDVTATLATSTSPTSTSSTSVTSVTSTESSSTEDKNRGWKSPPESDLTILKEVDVPESKVNQTLKSHISDEQLESAEDHYKYYNSTFVQFNSSWIDLEEWNRTIHPGIVTQHSMLSKSYRRAATISLKFKFPFYGHDVENITIATGGFLYTGDYVHSWLAATQYIAPLMANFDTSQEESATVKYADNGTTLVVEWGNVYLQGRDGASAMEGPFTFQAILHANGDIVFAYKTIPVSIMTITDDEHPVKVGLSDAYIIERTIFFVRRKTIYEYHRVNMKGKEIANYTAIYLKALPRCNMKQNCKECLALNVTEEGKEIQCMWCGSANLCSDGYDRNKQNWLKKNCEKPRNHLQGNPQTCDLSPPPGMGGAGGGHDYNPSYTVDDPHQYDRNGDQDSEHGHSEESDHFTDSKSNVHHTGVAVLTVVIILIITIFGWCAYAYFFPHTCSGQLLIKYRPSRWHWRRGEPRYTAASIHM